jgi:hypothetical protein
MLLGFVDGLQLGLPTTRYKLQRFLGQRCCQSIFRLAVLLIIKVICIVVLVIVGGAGCVQAALQQANSGVTLIVPGQKQCCALVTLASQLILYEARNGEDGSQE